MLELAEVNERNWPDVAALAVNEDQKGFLDSAVGILARGYVYRSCRARVIVIMNDGAVIGVDCDGTDLGSLNETIVAQLVAAGVLVKM